MEGQGGARPLTGLLLLVVSLVKDCGALGVNADPAGAGLLVDMREDAPLVHGVGAGPVVNDVGAVDDGDVAQDAYIDDFLLHREQVAGGVVKHLSDELVASADGAGRGDVNKCRRKEQLHGVLILVDEGDAPLVLKLLKLFGGGLAGLGLLRLERGCGGASQCQNKKNSQDSRGAEIHHRVRYDDSFGTELAQRAWESRLLLRLAGLPIDNGTAAHSNAGAAGG